MPNFSSPKVTIDLDEYNHLLNEVSRLQKENSGSETDTLKKVIWSALTVIDNKQAFYGMLSNIGVSLSINQRMASRSGEEYKELIISNIKNPYPDAKNF